jgi:hypothetical protein
LGTNELTWPVEIRSAPHDDEAAKINESCFGCSNEDFSNSWVFFTRGAVVGSSICDQFGVISNGLDKLAMQF